MKIFVTGATGVIGRRVIPLLVAAGDQVTALARGPDKSAALARMGASPVDVSLFNPRALHVAVAGHDAVINLATHMPSSPLRMLLPGAWDENDRVRREGSTNLVNATLAEGVQRFVQESFAPIYPDRGDEWIDESVVLAPSRYNRSVADAEQSAARFTSEGGEGVVLRFAAFYGPDARFLDDMIRMVRRGWAPVPGPAAAFVSSVSHDDAATAVITALGLPPAIYNVADDEPVTHRDYFDSLAAALGVHAPTLPPPWATFLFGATGRLLARSERISNRKLRAASGWAPRYRSVREGWASIVRPASRAPTEVRASTAH